MLIIDIWCESSGALVPLFLDQLAGPDFPMSFTVMRWSATFLLGAAWSFVRFATPRRLTLIALESGVTVGLGLLYVHLMREVPTYGPAFALLAIVLLLVVRASLVPSPVSRTLVIGIVSVAYLSATATESLETIEQPIGLWLTIMGGAFVVATAVTSHVIYGLRRQVHDAMRLGQYEIGRKLGEGAMGVVYEATHVMLRRPTALKVLPIEKAGEATVARFEREVQQTSRLEHPNSVYIYDYGRTPDGLFYYAMEYLDGVTLEELIEIDGPISPARAASILRQAARALAEAHAIGLVHRDIKPANIMLCERAQIPDTVKVLDFGLVKAIDSPEVNGNVTQANAIVGTPHYLAPESIARPADICPASDVYALGAIGFFLVTGREVFTGRSVVELCCKHLEATPQSPSRVCGRAIDPNFEALILRCLGKQPDKRPRDGAALADALDQIDLQGWTTRDARAWWNELEEKRTRTWESKWASCTQLAIDIEARRQPQSGGPHIRRTR